MSHGRSLAGPIAPTDANRELARLTLAYILTNPDISGVAVGMMLPDQVDNNVRACTDGAPVRRITGFGGCNKPGSLWAQLPPDYGWLRQWEHV